MFVIKSFCESTLHECQLMHAKCFRLDLYLMMVISMLWRIINTSHVNNNGTFSKFGRITGTDETGTFKFVCLLEHPYSQGFIAADSQSEQEREISGLVWHVSLFSALPVEMSTMGSYNLKDEPNVNTWAIMSKDYTYFWHGVTYKESREETCQHCGERCTSIGRAGASSDVKPL